MKISLAEYACPVCGKGLVTKAEPPGIIHKCDDCGVLMEADRDE